MEFYIFFVEPFPNHCKLNFMIEQLEIEELLEMKQSSAQLSPTMSIAFIEMI